MILAETCEIFRSLLRFFTERAGVVTARARTVLNYLCAAKRTPAGDRLAVSFVSMQVCRLGAENNNILQIVSAMFV